MFFDDNRTEDEKRADELLSELRRLRAHGNIPPEHPFKETVGGMIWRAREEKGITRVNLAKATGISQNSLAKYEKAGEDGGAYPPLPKMALICMELGLDPRTVMKRTFPFELDADDETFMPFKFEDFLRTLDVNKKELELAHFTMACEFKESQNLRKWNQQLVIEKLALKRQVKKLTGERNKYLHELNKRNGPDQKDPSRPEKPKNNPEAVSATSTRPKERKD